MSAHPTIPQPFQLSAWLKRNAYLLKPPVSNRLLFQDTKIVVQVIGGPNERVDFHDDPAEEFFYQLKGDMILKVLQNGKLRDIPIREGEVFLLPAHIRHSPQRPEEGSLGLVVEGARSVGAKDGFEWFCFECGHCVHRVEIVLGNIVDDLPPLFDKFYESQDLRTCSKCGAVHPGKTPPEGWAITNNTLMSEDTIRGDSTSTRG